MIGKDACTVVVCSCDRYADLLGPFVTLFRRYWPDCPFELVLVTETDPGVEDFDRTIACGGGLNWASRLESALGEIATPYVLMLCDDYYLDRTVNTEQLLFRLNQMKQYGAVNLRMIPNPMPKSNNSMPVEGGLFEYRKNTAYCIATQAGFWDRAFLRRLAAGKGSIWEFERYGSFEVSDETHPLLVTPTKEFPFLDAVHKGCWEPWGVRCLADNGIAFDFSKRGLPPLKKRIVEGVKGLVFALFPVTLIVRVQNALGWGAKERSAR